MKERRMILICVILSIASFTGIMLICASFRPIQTDILRISSYSTGDVVNVTGKVISPAVKEGVLLFTLRDSTGEIAVFVPSSLYESAVSQGSTPRENDTVSVIGEVSVYRGTLEIVASEIHPV